MSALRPTHGCVQLEAQGAVLLVTLNRPAQGNALHPQLIADLAESLRWTAAQDSFSAVVLTGAGKCFCTGLDLPYLATLESGQRREYMRTAFALFQQLDEFPLPVIAAVNGAAFAGGFDLAVFSDLRLCVPAAKFAQPEIILGVTQFISPLHHLIGLGRARELALTGEAIDAAEAYRIGLVNHIVEADALLPRARSLAQTLASRPRAALLETKRLGRELPGLDRTAAFERMGQALDNSIRSPEHAAALEQFLNRTRKS